MLIKPLMLGVSITLALLSLTILLRFLIYPLWLNIKSKRKQTTNIDYQDKTIEIRINHKLVSWWGGGKMVNLLLDNNSFKKIVEKKKLKKDIKSK